MRQIEKNLLGAIRNRKTWKQANTRTEALFDLVAVYLHDNHIANIYPNGDVEPNCATFKAWPTQTTKSRLRSLGIDASIKKFQPHINGQPI